MKYPHGILAITAAALLGAGLFAAGPGNTSGAGPEAEAVADDPFPQGCVDCHVAGKAGDIGGLLAAWGHRNVDRMTEAVPGDCAECHSEEGGYSLLGEFSHIVHFERPEKNAFVQDYGANCLHCHALDAGTGAVTVKSGPKNW